VRGLDSVVQHGWSCLDLTTMRAGLENLPEGLLQRTGVEREEVETLRRAMSEAL
jgi:hypothetical protein